MPPIETGPARPVGRIEPVSYSWPAVRTAGGSPRRTGETENAEVAVVLGDALNPGEAPVDAGRVAQIRQAIADGSYPIIPMTVADAIIAAGLILRSAK